MKEMEGWNETFFRFKKLASVKPGHKPRKVFFFSNVYVLLRDRTRTSRGVAERGDRGSEVGSMLTEASLMWGWNSRAMSS